MTLKEEELSGYALSTTNTMAKTDQLRTSIGLRRYVFVRYHYVHCVHSEVPCSQYPELSCASYNKNPAALNEPDGIVAVWNMHLLERPEFIFHSQVTAFHRR